MFLQSAVEIGRLDTLSLLPRKPLQWLFPFLKRRDFKRHPSGPRLANNDTGKKYRARLGKNMKDDVTATNEASDVE